MGRILSVVALLVCMLLAHDVSSTAAQKDSDPTKERATVTWAYFAGEDKKLIETKGSDKPNIRCSVIASDDDGDWVCLFVDSFPEITLPEGVNGDTIRPLLKASDEFKLKSARLRPKSTVAQTVSFVSASLESEYKLTIKPDGTVRFESTSITFYGKTKLSGSVSATWFVPKE